jgi:hypothetical protein
MERADEGYGAAEPSNRPKQFQPLARLPDHHAHRNKSERH